MKGLKVVLSVFHTNFQCLGLKINSGICMFYYIKSCQTMTWLNCLLEIWAGFFIILFILSLVYSSTWLQYLNDLFFCPVDWFPGAEDWFPILTHKKLNVTSQSFVATIQTSKRWRLAGWTGKIKFHHYHQQHCNVLLAKKITYLFGQQCGSKNYNTYFFCNFFPLVFTSTDLMPKAFFFRNLIRQVCRVYIIMKLVGKTELSSKNYQTYTYA